MQRGKSLPAKTAPTENLGVPQFPHQQFFRFSTVVAIAISYTTVITLQRVAIVAKVASLSSSSSASNPVARETVALAFQLSDYLASDHSFTSLFDESTRKTIKHIILNNFWPPSVSPDLPRTAREELSRARSGSVEEPSWPASWGHNKPSLRVSLKVFRQDTKALR